MASEFVDILRARDFYPEALDQHLYVVPSNDVAGLPLKKVPDGFNALSQIPGSLTVGTGLTFTVTMVHTNSADAGLVVRVGITVKKIANDETTDIDTAGSAESTVDVTLSATSGGLVTATKAIANAALDSVGAGDSFFVRVRRVSTATQDTANHTVNLLAVAIKNT